MTTIDEIRAAFPKTNEYRLDDVRIAMLLGLVVSITQPPSYRLPVLIFRQPPYVEKEAGHILVAYSYDENGCNWMPWVNGIDDRLGCAPPLPHYSDDANELLSVVEELRTRGIIATITVSPPQRPQPAYFVKVMKLMDDGTVLWLADAAGTSLIEAATRALAKAAESNLLAMSAEATA